MRLRTVSATRLGASPLRRKPCPAAQPRRWHPPKRNAKLVAVSSARLCTPKLNRHTVAQSVGDALGRIRAPTPPRAAATTTAFAKAPCKVGHTFGDAIMYPKTQGTYGCAECRRCAWAHSRANDKPAPRRSPDDAMRQNAMQCWSQFQGRAYVSKKSRFI